MSNFNFDNIGNRKANVASQAFDEVLEKDLIKLFKTSCGLNLISCTSGKVKCLDFDHPSPCLYIEIRDNITSNNIVSDRDFMKYINDNVVETLTNLNQFKISI